METNGYHIRRKLHNIRRRPPFLANVNVLYVVVRPSSVYNVRAPYSGDWNFQQCFYAIWYLGHLWDFVGGGGRGL